MTPVSPLVAVILTAGLDGAGYECWAATLAAKGISIKVLVNDARTAPFDLLSRCCYCGSAKYQGTSSQSQIIWEIQSHLIGI
jgi:hypothetical protein